MIKTIFLLQRARAQKPETIKDLKTGEYLKLDYMGSSEFEFGAIPKFQYAINDKLKDLVIESHTVGITTLYFACLKSDVKDYRFQLVELLIGNIPLKERHGMFQKDPIYPKRGPAIYDSNDAPFTFDCWFDLTNNCIISRDPKIIQNLLITIPNSVRYMDMKK